MKKRNKNMKDNSFLQEVGEKIKKQRKLLGLNQSSFNVTQSQYCKYEEGSHAMSILSLKDICEKLQISADYLLGLPHIMDKLTYEQEVNLHLLKQLNKKNNLYITGMLMVLLDKQKADEEKE